MELSNEEKNVIIKGRRAIAAGPLRSGAGIEVAVIMSEFAKVSEDYSFEDFKQWWASQTVERYPLIHASKVSTRDLYQVIDKMDAIATELGETLGNKLALEIPDQTLLTDQYTPKEGDE